MHVVVGGREDVDGFFGGSEVVDSDKADEEAGEKDGKRNGGEDGHCR